MRTIFDKEPSDWRDLQKKVAQAFTEMRCLAEIEKIVKTARGSVEVDVFVLDATRSPALEYLCECKHWNSRVPKSVVHSFRSVVADYGANAGFLISREGFQSGAVEAARHSNLHLLSWVQFQEKFFDNWFRAMADRLAVMVTDVFDYMNVLDDRIYPILSSSKKAQGDYYALFKKFSCFVYCNKYMQQITDRIEFPIKSIDPRGDIESTPVILFETPRGYFETMFAEMPRAIDLFKLWLLRYQV